MSLDTVLLLVYLAGAMLFLVPTARWFMREMSLGPPDNGDYVMAASIALCMVWLWPLYAPGWWIVKVLKTDEVKK